MALGWSRRDSVLDPEAQGKLEATVVEWSSLVV